MSRRAVPVMLVVAVLGVAIASAGAEPAAMRTSPFTKNVGQLPAEILYVASVPGGRLFVRAGDLVVQLVEDGRQRRGQPAVGRWPAVGEEGRARRFVNVSCRFAGGPFEVRAEDPLPGKVNLLLGNRPERWFTNVPQFGRVRVKGIAGGADLVLGATREAPAFWHVERSDGRPPGPVVPTLETSCPVRWERDRALIDTPFGNRTIVFPGQSSGAPAPRGAVRARGPVAADASPRAAAVTPVQLVWGTYLATGGESRSLGGSALDAAGNLYLVGSRAGTDGNLDTWVTMLTAAGPTRPWDVGFGSTLTEVGNAIAVDRDGSLVVVGYTDEPALPALGGYDGTINGGFDAFVVRLAPDQSVVWTTYLGGDGGDFAHAVAIGPGREVIVGGDTQSADFPTPAGFDTSFGGEVDGFLASLSADGASLAWATYLGGARWEHLAGVALSPDGGPVAVGASSSADFPTPGGLFRTNRGGTDFFVTSLGRDGAMRWGTLLGGTDSDLGEAVAVGPGGDVTVCGGTASADVPIVGGIQAALGGRPYDAYVARLDAAGDALSWATYLGGADSDTCSALRLDASDNIVLGGMSWSGDVPTRYAYSAALRGPADAYVATLASSGAELLWATYLGGSERDGAQALEVLPSGRVVVAGDTKSDDIPTTPGLDPTFSGTDDGFVVALSTPMPGVALAADFTWSPLVPALGSVVQFTDTSRGAPLAWSWSFGDGTTSTEPNPTHAFSACGTTTVSLTVGNPAGSGTVSRQLTVAPCTALAYSSWVPVASHAPGFNGSQWRTDVGVLNPGAATANLELRHLAGSTARTGTTFVPAGAQSILVDVVRQIGSSGTGPIRVRSDRPVIVSSRTYNVMPPDAACLPGGTQGQSYPALADGEGLSAGEWASLPQLTEDDRYRTNIMLVNVGAAPASATVTLYDGAGTQLGSPYAVSLLPGERKQQDKVFLTKAGRTNVARGYARIAVTSGSGVVAFASVVDNVTNDPTTVHMVRDPAPGP